MNRRRVRKSVLNRKKPSSRVDISICGSVGFYSISPNSEPGRAFMERVEGFNGDNAVCDDTRFTLDIARGAASEGLGVEFNSRRIRKAAGGAA